MAERIWASVSAWAGVTVAAVRAGPSEIFPVPGVEAFSMMSAVVNCLTTVA